MAYYSALGDYRSDLRRAAVTLAIVAAHLAVIIVILRSTGHSANVVDITFFALPINPQDRPRKSTPRQEPPISKAAESAPRHAAHQSATKPHLEPSLEKPSKSAPNTLHDEMAAHLGPTPPIDWRAAIETSARAVEQRDRIARGRRSLDGPNQPALIAPLKEPVCPYEQCEPGWGENLGVFKSSLHSKAGRVETAPDDMTLTYNGSLNVTGRDVILWTSNNCYMVIVSQDPARRGMNRCSVPLGKSAARGDLFDHMHEDQAPKSHDTEAPWISYSLSIGASRTDPRADR